MIYFDEETRQFSVVEDREFGMLTSALGGAASGATIGSFVPGIGTAIGAAAGAGAGLASGLTTNIRKAYKDKRRHERLMKKMDIGVTHHGLRNDNRSNRRDYKRDVYDIQSKAKTQRLADKRDLQKRRSDNERMAKQYKYISKA